LQFLNHFRALFPANGGMPGDAGSVEGVAVHDNNGRLHFLAELDEGAMRRRGFAGPVVGIRRHKNDTGVNVDIGAGGMSGAAAVAGGVGMWADELAMEPAFDSNSAAGYAADIKPVFFSQPPRSKRLELVGEVSIRKGRLGHPVTSLCC